MHLGSPERAKPCLTTAITFRCGAGQRSRRCSLCQLGLSVAAKKEVFTQFFVPSVWKAWLLGAVQKYGIGMIKEDADQIPGIFYLRDGHGGGNRL